MTQAESLYISASTNRHSHAADVCSSLICFACHKLVALWDTSDPSDPGVFVTLPGHQAEVNCVKFMQNGNIIASGDQKGALQIRMKKSAKWEILIDQPAHPRPISSLVTYENLVATGASDATVKLWRITTDGANKDTLDLVQTLDLNGRYPLDMQLIAFPGTSCLILAVASTGREIKIYTGTENQLVYSASLSGHEDWVKCLAFTQSHHSPPQLTLASGSQDGIIRLWTLNHITSAHPHQSGDDILDAFEASLADFSEGEEGSRQMSPKHHVIAIKSLSRSIHHFSLVLDALLISHEAGITSLSWRPQRSDCRGPLTLLSTSVDSSLIFWSPSALPNSSVDLDSAPLWISQQRFGDVGGQRLGGFVGGIWADSGCEVLGWGWNGGWRRWRCLPSPEGHSETWEEAGAVTGHHGTVKSIAWAPDGDYLLSTGLDQTSRIHGPHRRQSWGRESWHELARPQVHGYDIVGAEFMSPLRFVSIADEKVTRVFDAPKSFVATVNSLGTVRLPFSMESRPPGANVPPLGLSNKATTDEGQGLSAPAPIRYPYESELQSATLWPEIEKIFGHGYELISVATSRSGALFATACKSTTAEHAVVRVYNADDWQLVGEPLGGHTLTVTRIAFSPNDRMILSVSRDRTWKLFRATSQNNGYSPLATDRSHGRIIWDCAWMVEESEVAFATASRDKTVKFWQPTDDSLLKWTAVATLKFKEAVTAIDFSPVLCDGRRRIVVGLETGEIFVYSSQAADGWTLELTLESQLTHVDSIHRILWRPSKDKGLTQQLATCSEDRTIRVMIVHLGFH